VRVWGIVIDRLDGGQTQGVTHADGYAGTEAQLGQSRLRPARDNPPLERERKAGHYILAYEL